MNALRADYHLVRSEYVHLSSVLSRCCNFRGACVLQGYRCRCRSYRRVKGGCICLQQGSGQCCNRYRQHIRHSHTHATLPTRLQQRARSWQTKQKQLPWPTMMATIPKRLTSCDPLQLAPTILGTVQLGWPLFLPPPPPAQLRRSQLPLEPNVGPNAGPTVRPNAGPTNVVTTTAASADVTCFYVAS
jgi:hypothetical protein